MPVSATNSATRAALGAIDAADFQTVANVFRHVHIRKERIGLKNHADIASFDRYLRHFGFIEQDPPAVIWHFQSGNDAEQSCLAAA